MSDGNFNTKLLAPGGFTSGVRTGEARMRQKALTAFGKVIATADFITPDQAKQLTQAFHQQLG